MLDEYTGEGEPYEVWNLTDRLTVLHDAMTDAESTRRFQLRCKTDMVFYTNACVDTYNPRDAVEKELPLFLEMRQAEYLLHLHWCVTQGLARVCLKTRYVGASWLEMVYDSHQWLFTPRYNSRVGSWRQDLVDAKGQGSGDSLFEKFDYIIKRLPVMVRPVGYEPKAPHKVEFTRSNPAIGSSIAGEAVTDNFGSGPRATRILIDEFSKVEANIQQGAWVACGQTTDSQNTVFTAKGKNFAYGLAFPDEWKKMHNKSQVVRPELFRIHWKDIPRFNRFYFLDEQANAQWENIDFRRELLKQRLPQITRWFDENNVGGANGYSPIDTIPLGMGYDDGRGNITRLRERQPLGSVPQGCVAVVYPWYEREKLKYDEVGIAQELDINFDESVSRRVYKPALHLAKTFPIIARDPDFPLYFGLDPGRSSGNAAFLIWAQFNWDTRRYEFVREYTNEGRDAYFYVPLINGLERDYQYLERGDPSREDIAFFEESMDPIWRVTQGYGDPFIENKGASNDSWKTVFLTHDIPIRCNTQAKSPWDRVNAFRDMLPFCDFSLEGAGKFYLAISEIAFPKEGKGGSTQGNTFSYEHHPVYSHPVAAGEYIAVNEPHKYDRGSISNEETTERRNRAEYGAGRAERTPGISGSGTGNGAARVAPDGYEWRGGVLVPSADRRPGRVPVTARSGSEREGRYNRRGYGDGHLYPEDDDRGWGRDSSGY